MSLFITFILRIGKLRYTEVVSTGSVRLRGQMPDLYSLLIKNLFKGSDNCQSQLEQQWIVVIKNRKELVKITFFFLFFMSIFMYKCYFCILIQLIQFLWEFFFYSMLILFLFLSLCTTGQQSIFSRGKHFALKKNCHIPQPSAKLDFWLPAMI